MNFIIVVLGLFVCFVCMMMSAEDNDDDLPF